MPSHRQPTRDRAVPLGTQVVTRIDAVAPEGHTVQPAGSVAVILQSPAESRGAYRVRFPNGTEALLTRKDFQVRKELAKTIGLARGQSHDDLHNYVIFRCVIGSRAYGLDDATSDVDRRGIYLPPADREWSLLGIPEQLERDDTQECYWELEKFLRLAMRANPNVLECLYTPLIEQATPLACELLAMREMFLTRQVYQTYNGYVLSQFKKLSRDMRDGSKIRWKHPMHLVRLLLSGIAILRGEGVPVRVGQHRERLLAIRRGEVSWATINSWRKELHAEFDKAWLVTELPEHPDYDRVDTFLLKARRSMVDIAPTETLTK